MFVCVGHSGAKETALGWKVVERKIGKAGALKRRMAKQREWDRRFGEGMWSVGYVIDGAFEPYERALELVYQASYDAFLDDHPELVDALCRTARVLRNPHAEATTGVDLQVPAILDYLGRRGLELKGDEVVDIGSWSGETTHAMSVTLSPLHIPCVARPKTTLERFWQARKCLAVWED